MSCYSVGLQLWAVGLALVIMPGDLGVYAAESLSAASAPESAYTALGEMSRQRAGQWSNMAFSAMPTSHMP